MKHRRTLCPFAFAFLVIGGMGGAACLSGNQQPNASPGPTHAEHVAEKVASPSAPRLDLHFDPDAFTLSKKSLVSWVQQSADAVAAFYGRFPVDRVRIDLRPVQGAGIRVGFVFDDEPLRIRIDIGRETQQSQLNDDWVLVHELVHLALPDLDERHHWLEEGLATYVERIVRVRAGLVDEQEMWSHFVWGMAKGRPRGGDRGLDATPTWGRTYWGGALFCMVADVRIRRQTQGQFGLEDAMRSILLVGGNREVVWPIERILRVGDDAVGVHVLTDIYAEMALSPRDVDLDAFWQRMGVYVSNGEFAGFDDSAPWADVRKSITQRSDQLASNRPVVLWRSGG